MATFNLDANWTNWIRENLIRGSDEATIAGILCDNFSVTLVKAHTIIQKVKETPISAPVAQANNQALERREWMLKTLDKLSALSSGYGKLERVSPPSFEHFLEHYYATNRPVILEQAFAQWQAADWEPLSLLDTAQDKTVEVQFNREANPHFEMDSIQHKKKMPFSEYYQKVMSAESSNDFYMTANNARENQQVFKPLFAQLGNVADGYFDETLHATRSFIWFGPKGNFTPLHHDQTNNMFMQVYGRKKFWLVSPLQTPYLYNETAVFSPIDLRNIDVANYPLAKNITPIEVILEPGETLFIPIGWWHQVESMDISISLTLTNFNAPNSFT